MYEHIDLARIPIFLTVAECLSFTEAAYQLYTTQSSVSKSVSALEASIGFPLFVRENRKITLTQEGDYLYHSLKNCMNNINEALIYASKIHEGNNGSLSIGASGYIPKTPEFESVCFQFTDVFSNYELELRHLHYAKLRKSLMDEKVDGILVNDKDVAMLRGYQYITFRTGGAVLAYNQYLDIDRETLVKSLDEIKNAQFVCLNPDLIPKYQGYLLECCKAYGFTPKIMKYVDSMQELIHYIGTSKYISIFDKTIFPMAFSDINFIPVAYREGMPDPLKTVFVWKKENANPALQNFVELAADCLETEIDTI